MKIIVFGWEKAVSHCTFPRFYKSDYYWFASWLGRRYFLTTNERMEALQKEQQNG